MDISSEMNSMVAKLEQNENVCRKRFSRLELLNGQNVPNENLQFSKCRLRKPKQVKNNLFT